MMAGQLMAGEQWLAGVMEVLGFRRRLIGGLWLFEIIIKSLDSLRAKKTFIGKTLGRTMVSAVKASSVTLYIWQKEPEENTVNLQISIMAVISKTVMSNENVEKMNLIVC